MKRADLTQLAQPASQTPDSRTVISITCISGVAVSVLSRQFWVRVLRRCKCRGLINGAYLPSGYWGYLCRFDYKQNLSEFPNPFTYISSPVAS